MSQSRRTSRRTPCIGICSTTYGDLVCRGCKRFAHEIVQWNSYDLDQQAQIRARLDALRDEVIEQHLRIADGRLVRVAQQQAGLDELQGTPLLYGLLQFLGARSMSLGEAGLCVAQGGVSDARAALRQLDAEIYQRSMAHYERNFRVLT